MSKAVRDKHGVVLKYPERTCKDCRKFPCFKGFEYCISDFAKYGCTDYKEKGNIDNPV